MHEVRYMHRDVSTQNLLIMSLNLLKIVFYDFDKVRHASSYRDTHIELISTLAPKVDGYTWYNSSIDIWDIGYVCYWILFLKFVSKYVDIRLNETWHIEIMAHFIKYKSSESTKFYFANLIRQMLAWTLAHRPSAIEILQHLCRQAIFAFTIANSLESQERSRKLPKLRHDASNEVKNDLASSQTSSK